MSTSARQPRASAIEPALRRSEEHTSELQSRPHLVCRLLLEKKKRKWCCSNALIKASCVHESGIVIGYSLPAGDAGVIFFFNDTATTEIYTLSLHDALPNSIEPALR